MAKVKRPTELDAQPDEIVEVQPIEPVNVSLTNTVYRLAPASSDAAQPQCIAIVGAESEVQARALAATHDPFGLNWMDEAIFVCRIEYTEEPHVIGDVMFKSVAPATPEKRRKWQRSKN